MLPHTEWQVRWMDQKLLSAKVKISAGFRTAGGSMCQENLKHHKYSKTCFARLSCYFEP